MNASQLQSGDIFRFLGGRTKFLAKAQRESSHGSTWLDAVELDAQGRPRLLRCIAYDRPVTVVSRASVPAGVPVAAGDVAGVELPHAAPPATACGPYQEAPKPCDRPHLTDADRAVLDAAEAEVVAADRLAAATDNKEAYRQAYDVARSARFAAVRARRGAQ